MINSHRGLPPRGRGRVTNFYRIMIKKRITPAWAGKSFIQMKIFRKLKDYPRVGGEEFVIYKKME